MASAYRKSTSLTDVAKLNRNLKDFGSAVKDMNKVEQRKTSCDLSDCVGLANTPCPKPKEPLGSQPRTSLLKPSWSCSQLRQGRNILPPKKASSVTVSKSDDVLSKKRTSCKKSDLPRGNQFAYGNKNNPTGRSVGRNSRIPLLIRTIRTSRSENDMNQAKQEKPVVKRHFSSPTLGGKVMPSKIPVKIQNHSKTSYDLSDCVGPANAPCPNPEEPLGSQTRTSLLKPSWSCSQPRQGRNTQPPKKASSVTVSKSDDVLSSKRTSCKKSDFPSGNQFANGNKNKPAARSEGSNSRIPLLIRTVRASKSENDMKQAKQEKPVVKRHFSSPTLGGEVMPSKIPVRIQKGNKKDSTGKTNRGVMAKPASPTSNGKFQGKLSVRERRPVVREKQDILNSSTNSNPTEKLVEAIQPDGVCESSILIVSCETDSGDEIVEKKNSRNEPPLSKDKFHLTEDLPNKDGAGRSCQPSSLIPVGFEKDSSLNSKVDTEGEKDSNEEFMEFEEKLLGPTLPGSFESFCPALSYHQSSILLLVCETELSSESGAESDVKFNSVDKLPEGMDAKSSTDELKVFTSSDQTPKIERDSGIVLSRATTVSNQSSLLVISHDTDCSTDQLQQKGDNNVKSQEERKEKDCLQATSSSDDKWKNERFSQKLDTIEMNYKSSTHTDKDSDDNHGTDDGSLSLQSSDTTQNGVSVTNGKKYSLVDEEFIRMTQLLNTTVPPPLNLMKEIGIQKEKRRRRKRTHQQPAPTARVGVLSQHTADRWLSHSLISSSDEENDEMRHGEGTNEYIGELGNFKKENVLLRGKFERIKQTNSTLRSNEKTLLKKIEDEIDKNELLSNKSRRLRAQVKNLKRELKRTKTESKKQEKALRKNVENLKTKLAAEDKLNSTLKADLQESEKVVARQKMKFLEVDKILSEHVVKINLLEKRLEAKQDELHHADRLVAWQKDEIQKAKEEVAKQKAELRVADEETVKQLEKIQKTFAVFEEREHSLEEAKALSDKRVACLEEQVSTETQKFAKIEEQLEEEQNKNIALKVHISDLKSQLAASHSLEQKASKMNGDLWFKNERLVNECKRLQEEIMNIKLQLKKSESELHKAVIAKDMQCKQFEQQLVSVENEKNKLKRLNSQITCQLNISKTDKSTGKGQEAITPQCEVDQMKECAQLKELVKRMEAERRILVTKTEEEKERMRVEIDRLSKEGLRKDKDLDMMESSLEELGRVKNIEIMGLKRVMRRLEENCAALKEELKQKEDETKVIFKT